MNDEMIGQFLEALASSAPAPGGGAAAGLLAALGAALVSMVCNLTLGREKYRDHEALIGEALTQADALRQQAIALADQDAVAFSAVRAAYGAPRSSNEEKAARQERIQEALKDAAAVPLQTAAVAAGIVDLCNRIVDKSNTNVISDVGVAALSARAALESAALNVRINLALIQDTTFTGTTAVQLQGYLDMAQPLVDAVMRTVNAEIRV